ncbi:hypothetical protein OSB04_024766 [Centaurea solstitialis]|uniref:SWIM-type domain-containing protein n=1 Tax=Centaurea solstitialis TaxID=347529 RepID=A0AA38WCE1_9ASTR|nr:hypothetical protein OSB04_024766 [Centaurea solstitialis]
MVTQHISIVGSMNSDKMNDVEGGTGRTNNQHECLNGVMFSDGFMEVDERTGVDNWSPVIATTMPHDEVHCSNNEEDIISTGHNNNRDVEDVVSGKSRCIDDDMVYEIVENSSGQKLFIPIVADELKPKTHTVFPSLSEAETMYRNYAAKAGFDVRKDAKKTNKFGDIQTRWFVCSREGFPAKKGLDSLDLRTGERRSRNSNLKRSGCDACIKIHLTKDRTRYEVYEFLEAHNHVLFNSNDRRFSRKNRQMLYTDYKRVLNSSNYKIGSTRAHHIQSALKGGFDQPRGTVVDYKNFKRDAIACVGNKDAQMLLNKLSNRREFVPYYFYEYKCDGRELKAIFWADENARLNYKEFGDVVSFDGTYRTNKHAMVFVPFLSIDNHKGSVVVGSALLGGETIENFTWVLKAFLKCHQKQPVFVITDQCKAMKQAVPLVFTESRHRLCMWHIMNKLPRKASFIRYNMLIILMIEEYGLVGDPWFTKMYAIRHSWIPAFYRGTPMSGLMKTTSRSESSNAYINLFECFESDLVQFLSNYDTAIEKQRYKYSVKESETRTTYPRFITPLPLERHASQIYSRTIFFDIQKEIKKAAWVCAIEVVEGDGDVKTFVISHNTKLSTEKIKLKVRRDYANNTVECQCDFFITHGILCRHALKVLINDKVDCIPSNYILRRWTRQLVPLQMNSARVRYGEVDAEKEKRMLKLYHRLDGIVSRARNNEDVINKLDGILGKFATEIEKELPFEDPSQQKLDALKEHFGVPVPDDPAVLPPTGLANKGCGTGKRLKSTSEKIQSKSKRQKRKCARCGLRNGHDSRNCPTLRG